MALEFLVEAKGKKLADFIGITGHGLQAPRMHSQSLKRFGKFDSVLLPCNYLLMQNPDYAVKFKQVVSHCKERNIAVQTIKAVARGLWGEKNRSHTAWYEPLTDGESITKCVHWVMGWPDIFLVTPGDIQVLPKVLEAAAKFELPPSDGEMEKVVERQGMESVFE